ncbi:hypothetical protein SAMN02745165_02948 [Malonomonas rubra DSM 5091]|uniref:Uncharacterized protein n=1 Tax=Malonomonas rubra DSM 5091 TaxID=1122189 RepID=A0A1M6LEK1_MALRU|nr:hypothetical protein [Malonomonas rubra]SHJ69525.1 hypothetical protein SAMN02745165_02948 [Malonomonas rubra DSM 5091]
MRKLTVLFFIVFVLLAHSAVAEESTINCHCFTDRTFDHQNPEKVVPYLLATTQNSFLAVAFNAQKFRLVKDLMSGVPSEQLWISHYVAARSGLDTKSVMTMRQIKGSWRGALKEAGLLEEQLSSAIGAALEKADDEQLATAVVDEALLYLMRVDSEQLTTVRQAGADNREAILCFFLAKRTGEPAPEIYRSVKDKQTNWGTLAFINNVQIGEMEQELKAILN